MTHIHQSKAHSGKSKATRRALRSRLLLSIALLFGGSLTSEELLMGSAQAQWCCGSKPASPYPVGSPYAINGYNGNPTAGMPATNYPPANYPPANYPPANYAAARPMIPVTPITPSNGGMTSYYGNYGMLPPTTGNVLPNGVPQTVVSAMPTAAYDTQWQRTPVTYYRPVTQYDPNYGTTVTSLQPCTSYQYQAQRVPLVAPTPVGGQYAQASNQWPAINQPGYYPTGVASTSNMLPTLAPVQASTVVAPPTLPNYPPVQTLPNAGMQIAPGQPAGQSITSGMPSYSTQATFTPFGIPSVGGSVTAGSAVPAGSAATAGNTVPATATVPQAGQAGTLSNGVYYGGAPATSPLAGSTTANCPNGLCPTTGNLVAPVVAGATSVTPYGPVTYLPAKPAMDPASQPVLQQQVLPPTSNPQSGAVLDPEAHRVPSLAPSNNPPATSAPAAQPAAQPGTGAGSTSTAGLWSDNDSRVAKMVPMNRLPLVPIDSPSATGSTAQSPVGRAVKAQSDPANSNLPTNPFPGAASSAVSKSNSSLMPAPSASNNQPILPPNLLPLKAPAGFEGKPQWNPKLLVPNPAASNNGGSTRIDDEKVAVRGTTPSVNPSDRF